MATNAPLGGASKNTPLLGAAGKKPKPPLNTLLAGAGAVGDQARDNATAVGVEHDLEHSAAAGLSGNIAIGIAKAMGIETGIVGGPTGGTIGGHKPGGTNPNSLDRKGMAGGVKGGRGGPIGRK
jgi:hypothetical protein